MLSLRSVALSASVIRFDDDWLTLLLLMFDAVRIRAPRLQTLHAVFTCVSHGNPSLTVPSRFVWMKSIDAITRAAVAR